MSSAIEIVVVGAHMTDMPLNPKLKSLGASFARAAKTTPEYRLYALAGGPPRRPGLLRVAVDCGVSIETEVWRLGTEGFGAFVAEVPAPLCIGTVRLADGTSPKGFLVEPEGVVGAVDISALGGWRAFMNTALATTK
jgi:allophanate hydrolase